MAPTDDRPWIKVRLSAGSLDVEGIVANWRMEKKAAENLAMGVRLVDALQRGDLAAALEICPMLGLAFAVQQKPRKTKRVPLLESDSLTDPVTLREPDSEGDMLSVMMQAIGEVTETDIQVNRQKVRNLARKLVEAGYTTEDVQTWLVRCWRTEWPGNKGDKPTLADLQQRIGRVRMLSPEPSPADATNPYLQDEYFTRHTDEDFEPDLHPEEAPLPEASSAPNYHVPGWVQDRWLATKGQLEVQLNRATFDTWLKHTQPVHFVGDRNSGTLYVTVPHRYAKDWIDKHLRTALNKSFDALLNYDGQTKRRISQDALFDVEIVVEGDSINSEAGKTSFLHRTRSLGRLGVPAAGLA
jgi:hypothetical protein